MTDNTVQIGQIASLHIHPGQSGGPMIAVDQLTLVAGKGIREDVRYFDRQSRRKVTVISREVLCEHAGMLGLESIFPGKARSNIETTGIDLISLINQDVQLGEAVLRFYEARTPCHQMEAVAPGLRTLMENGRQGVLATVVSGGIVRVGDRVQAIRIVDASAIHS